MDLIVFCSAYTHNNNYVTNHLYIFSVDVIQNINLYLFNIYSILSHFDLHNFIIFDTYFLCYFLLRFSSKFDNLVKAANPHLVMYILDIDYHSICLYSIIQLEMPDSETFSRFKLHVLQKECSIKFKDLSVH